MIAAAAYRTHDYDSPGPTGTGLVRCNNVLGDRRIEALRPPPLDIILPALGPMAPAQALLLAGVWAMKSKNDSRRIDVEG